MSNIKDITGFPIQVLEILRKYIQKESYLFERIPFDSGFIKYKGTGINKNTSFSILSHKMNNGQVVLNIEYNPSTHLNPSSTQRNVSAMELDTQFSSWCKLLEKYKELSEVFEEASRFENIVEEIYSDFDFQNASEQEFFTITELIKIDSAIADLDGWIELNESKFLPVLYEEIKKEIAETQNGLHENSKGWIARKIAKIHALILKQGPRFLKETAVEVVKLTLAEIIKTKLLT